ncbi:MAG: shikimate kinase [Thermodesulfovibrionales bacterium]
MKNIVLTGFMGTGKTEVGRLLAMRLGYKFIDADSVIEEEQKMPITEIFKKFGEPYFRDIESNVIKRLSDMEGVVISTGGGAVLREENMNNLRKKGVIICLMASPKTIFERTKNDTSRPLLQVNDPLQRIKELLNMRRPYYEKADIMIDTDRKTPEEVAEEIIKKIQTSGGKI